MSALSVNAEIPGLLLTDAEAAKLTRLCPKTLYRERKAGRLAYVRVGTRRVLYRIEDLKAFAERHLQPAAEQQERRRFSMPAAAAR